MSIGGFDSIGQAEAADIADALAIELGSFPDAPNIDIPVSQLGPSPQDIQLQQQVFDDLTLPQEAIQTGLGILAEDADPFVPSNVLPEMVVDDDGGTLKQLAIPVQISDVIRQAITPQDGGLLGGAVRVIPYGGALRTAGKIGRDLLNTGYQPTEQDRQFMETALAPDLDDIRRSDPETSRQIGLPVEEQETPDQSPFFQPVTDVAFLDPREPNLLNLTPANLQSFLTARNLPNVDYQALNTAFAQRPPFGLPVASNTSLPSLLS